MTHIPEHLLATDDDLVAPEVGQWAVEKYRRLDMYCRLFATGMKNQWDQRVYVDLYAGCGHSRIRGSNTVVIGSPLIALTVPDPFTKYILVERNPELLEALKQRVQRVAPGADVSYHLGDVNEDVEEVVKLIPAFGAGNTQLSFAFADPFSVDLRFETIERLSRGRSMDLLILLALGMDANRNIALYTDENHQRIEHFLGNPEWREAWSEASRRGEKFIYFLATQYIEAMKRIGYRHTEPGSMYPVRSDQRNLGLYYLAFFSKHPLGDRFWKEVLKYTDAQFGLGL